MQGTKLVDVVDGIEIPDWLIDLVFCEENKKYIETPEINQFLEQTVLPILSKKLGDPEGLHLTAAHVHIGSDGLDPHDHLPHHYATVLYLMDAEGEIKLHFDSIIGVAPKEGRLLIMDASVVHSVEPSSGLRVALVSNYATTPLQGIPEAV